MPDRLTAVTLDHWVWLMADRLIDTRAGKVEGGEKGMYACVNQAARLWCLCERTGRECDERCAGRPADSVLDVCLYMRP